MPTPISVADICYALTGLEQTPIPDSLRSAITVTLRATSFADAHLCFLPLLAGVYVQLSHNILYACRLPDANPGTFTQPIDDASSDVCLVVRSTDFALVASSAPPSLATDVAFDIDLCASYQEPLATAVEKFHFFAALSDVLGELESVNSALAAKVRALSQLRSSPSAELYGDEIHALNPLAVSVVGPKKVHAEGISPLDLPDRILHSVPLCSPYSFLLLGSGLDIEPQRLFERLPAMGGTVLTSAGATAE